MRILVVLIVLLCAGCATYTTPGAGAGLEQLGRAGVERGSARQPAPQFPASIAVVRVQAAPYKSRTAEGEGRGRYTVVVPQEVPTTAQLQQIAAWPSVDTASPLNRTWLPAKLDSLDDLRIVAAKMQVDVLMVCTLGTVFQVQGQTYAPGSSIGTGTQLRGPATISTQASAVFVDVRTGYEYGHVEGSAGADVAEALASVDALDHQRLQVEGSAFTQLLTNAAKTWAGIAQQYQ